MRARSYERIMWIVAIVVAGMSVLGWRRTGATRVTDTMASARRGIGALTFADSTPLARMAERIVARDPFRLDRRPAEVRFDPDPAPERPVPRSNPAVTSPVLRGITGPPWQAVLEGVPGHERAVVARVGSAFGPLVVTRISRDTVIIEAADTSFTLTVRRAWR